ncbi:hypothetical protein SCARR_03163 [Pontiella sulfatireligans]|uniref:Uncharacterized protein n=1 Tax=Pontiella sulfatireligans TaxID=2750658 RepID=A0A6C2UP50_9BACT|nr:hypothetical protein SCARR_03163 [Pontiella sulfatireligans]
MHDAEGLSLCRFLRVSKALEKGMQEKSREFAEQEAEIYT